MHIAAVNQQLLTNHFFATWIPPDVGEPPLRFGSMSTRQHCIISADLSAAH